MLLLWFFHPTSPSASVCCIYDSGLYFPIRLWVHWETFCQYPQNGGPRLLSHMGNVRMNMVKADYSHQPKYNFNTCKTFIPRNSLPWSHTQILKTQRCQAEVLYSFTYFLHLLSEYAQDASGCEIQVISRPHFLHRILLPIFIASVLNRWQSQF